jgi:hypothetical protein
VLNPGGRAIIMLYHKASFNYHFRIMFYMRLRVLLTVLPRAFIWERDRERFRAAGVSGLRGNEDQRIWEVHYANFLREGWSYLRAKNFVHHCTDGPDCPIAYAFSKKEAKNLFGKFAAAETKVAHFPLRRYRAWVPFAVEKWLAARMGWYLFIFAQKPGASTGQ